MKKFLLVMAVLLLSAMVIVPSEGANEEDWKKALDYYYGRNSRERNYREAAKWFKAYGDFAGPNFYLGNIYQDGGYGVEKDEKEAAKFYKKAIPQNKVFAEKGEVSCMWRLGYMYQLGLGTEVNHKEALKWLKKGVEKNNDDCMFRLAIAYYEGLGVERDYKEAAKWFKRLSSMKDWISPMNYLGLIYDNGGSGVEQDYAEAMRWYEKAAGKNHSAAMCNIGQLYEKGNGVPADKEKAIEWYKKSLAGGHEHAKEGLERLGIK